MRWLLWLSNTFSCRSFSMLNQFIISLLCYFNGVPWDLKSFIFSLCKASEVDPFIKFLRWYRYTHSILHKSLLCVFYQHISYNNVFLSSHVSLFSHLFSPVSWTRCERIWSELQLQITKTAWFPIKIRRTHTLDRFWICNAEFKSGCCPNHMIQY